LPGLDLGNLLLVLVLLLAGVELLGYAWNWERGLLVGGNKIQLVTNALKGQTYQANGTLPAR
jgi:hypothetical protein